MFGQTMGIEELITPTTVHYRDSFGTTPLVYLFDAPYTVVFRQALVVAFLRAGASVHARNEDGETPLHQAVYCGAIFVRLLLQAGADVNAVDNGGETALHFCAYGGFRCEPAMALIVGGADVLRKSVKGETARDISSRYWTTGGTPLVAMLDRCRVQFAKCQLACRAVQRVFLVHRRGVMSKDMINLVAQHVWRTRCAEEWGH